MTCLLFMSGSNCGFHFPLIYHQKLTASKYNLAAFNQSPHTGAETQPWVVFICRWVYIFCVCFVLFSCCYCFCGRFVLFVCFPKVKNSKGHFDFTVEKRACLCEFPCQYYRNKIYSKYSNLWWGHLDCQFLWPTQQHHPLVRNQAKRQLEN